jgi:hypothetical protein
MNIKKLVNSIFASFIIFLGIQFIIVFITSIQGLQILFLVIWLIVGAWFYERKTNKHIWRYCFIFLSIESFLLPIVMLVYGFLPILNKQSGAELLGGMFAGVFVILLLGFLGLFFGIIFLIIGLLIFKIPEEKTSKL